MLGAMWCQGECDTHWVLASDWQQNAQAMWTLLGSSEQPGTASTAKTDSITTKTLRKSENPIFAEFSVLQNNASD